MAAAAVVAEDNCCGTEDCTVERKAAASTEPVSREFACKLAAEVLGRSALSAGTEPPGPGSQPEARWAWREIDSALAAEEGGQLDPESAGTLRSA